MSGVRSTPTDVASFDEACTAIIRVARRVYAHDQEKSNRCANTVAVFRGVVEQQDHTADYDPYRALAILLRGNFPLVWDGDELGSAKQELAPWVVL